MVPGGFNWFQLDPVGHSKVLEPPAVNLGNKTVSSILDDFPEGLEGSLGSCEVDATLFFELEAECF